MSRTSDVITSFALSVARLGAGMKVGPLGPRPRRRLELYEFEACPFCRKVREVLSFLDLEAVIYPCPKDGPTYRAVAREKGGKTLFPYLVDPNTDEAMYESEDIIRYLFSRYGNGSAPFLYTGNLAVVTTGFAGIAVRGSMGLRYVPSRKPEQMLELYSFEASPYCRIVREVLCSLEVPYVLHNVAKGSPGRDAFVERSGRMLVPYLVDPNTGVSMFESEDIKEYLLRTYAV